MAFKKIDISELSFNPFEKIGKQWMLLTAGDSENFNTMTASWGQLGVLWNKNILNRSRCWRTDDSALHHTE